MIAAPHAASWGPAVLHAPLLKEALPLLLTPLLLAGYAYRAALAPALRRAHLALVAAVLVAFGGLLALRARTNVASPPEWDAQCFWLYGRVAAAGADFYSPAAFHAVHRTLAAREPLLSTTPVFSREVLDVSFPYPPPTILLVAPLGWFDLQAGVALWYAAIVAALAGAVYLLWRTFLPGGGPAALAVTAALVVTFRGTYTTFAFGQTSLLVLVMLLLFWRARDRLPGGAYLALGTAVKPVFAFVALWPVLRGRWRTLAAAAAAGGVLLLATAALFGPRTVATYLTDNPIARAPDGLYAEPVNQSLAATIVRLTHHNFADGSPLTQPLFLTLALTIAAVTGWLVARLGPERGDVALALLLPTALLIYPHSLEHYTVLLLAPLFLLWTRGEELGVSRPLAIALVSAEFALVRYDKGVVAIAATALLWLVLVGVGARQLARPRARATMRPAVLGD